MRARLGREHPGFSFKRSWVLRPLLGCAWFECPVRAPSRHAAVQHTRQPYEVRQKRTRPIPAVRPVTLLRGSIRQSGRKGIAQRYPNSPGVLLQNGGLRGDFPFPLQVQVTRSISAVPRALKLCVRATRMWMLAVWRPGSLAVMHSPKDFRQRILASARLRT